MNIFKKKKIDFHYPVNLLISNLKYKKFSFPKTSNPFDCFVRIVKGDFCYNFKCSSINKSKVIIFYTSLKHSYCKYMTKGYELTSGTLYRKCLDTLSVNIDFY